MGTQNIPKEFSHFQVNDEFAHLAERLEQLNRPEMARHAVTDIFSVMRNCISFEDSLEFINLLPLPFKAIYLNGWHIGNASHTKINSLEELIDEITASPFVHEGWYNSNRDDLREILKALFDVIGNYIGRNIEKPELSFLPNDIQYFILHYHTEADNSSSETSIWLS